MSIKTIVFNNYCSGVTQYTEKFNNVYSDVWETKYYNTSKAPTCDRCGICGCNSKTCARMHFTLKIIFDYVLDYAHKKGFSCFIYDDKGNETIFFNNIEETITTNKK